MSNIIRAILSFGPGIFAIGYTIGSGSVIFIIVAGRRLLGGILFDEPAINYFASKSLLQVSIGICAQSS